MRIRNEPVEIRRGRIPDPTETLVEGPAQFLWRDRVWLVRGVQQRWSETGAWWESGPVRAARGEDVGAAAQDDLLGETETWRVVAGCGRRGPEGVYDLVHQVASGRWLLRAVWD